MSAADTSRAPALYSPRLLALATHLAHYPLEAKFDWQGEGRSQTCGGTIALGFAPDGHGRIARGGCAVSACAVGQASAAILMAGAGGREPNEIVEAARQVERWLDGSGGPPDWPGVDALEPARARPGRRGALLMAWRAAAEALSSPARPR